MNTRLILDTYPSFRRIKYFLTNKNVRCLKRLMAF